MPMQTTWIKCYRCSGKGYERNEIEGSHPCVQCDGVGKVEVDELADEPKIVSHQNNPLSEILRDALDKTNT
jgi:DnaJ-class molecular chaperone